MAMPNMARLLAALIESLGFYPAVFVGHSAGAALAMRLGLTSGKLLESVMFLHRQRNYSTLFLAWLNSQPGGRVTVTGSTACWQEQDPCSARTMSHGIADWQAMLRMSKRSWI
jgi:pimeloyl-ACP methyl ester carboxylesterase